MTTADHTPQVVFACVRNGGRSVISRVLTEHYAHGAVIALSAGTQPGEHIHAEVAAVLEKLGLDTSREQPTLLTRDTIASSDVAITLGCGEECPYVPGVKYVDWPVQDPAGQDEAPFVQSSPTSTPGSVTCLSSSFPASSCHPQWSTSRTEPLCLAPPATYRLERTGWLLLEEMSQEPCGRRLDVDTDNDVGESHEYDRTSPQGRVDRLPRPAAQGRCPQEDRPRAGECRGDVEPPRVFKDLSGPAAGPRSGTGWTRTWRRSR